MTEEEARDWIDARFGLPGVAAMETLAGLVRDESARQNLVAASTLDSIWSRHIVDSAQLLALADVHGRWLDIGSGAGFPGLVVAALGQREVCLVEPRRKRAEFLKLASAAMACGSRVTVIDRKVERTVIPSAIISARAVAPLATVFAAALQCSSGTTLWLLPKGVGAREEIARAQQSWHGSFHVERSVTDAESLIVLARKVSRR